MPQVEAKSGSSWKQDELDAFKIEIDNLNATNFFGGSLGHGAPVNGLDQNLFARDLGADYSNFSVATATYLGRLEDAAKTTQESAIDTLVFSTLELLGFGNRDRIMVQERRSIRLAMSGQTRHAKTNICLRHRPSSLFLIVVENKTRRNAHKAEPQVIAEAIAAFGFNNRMRRQANLGELNRMEIPCITMCGTRPTFYIVPVTKSLATAVKNGRYRPANLATTRVKKYETKLGRADGMRNKEYRELVLRRLLAFKHLAEAKWRRFLRDIQI